jgi:hypothetical protein
MGEEVTHAYVDIGSTTAVRKEHLMRMYRFDCTCAECLEPWGQRDRLLEGDLRGRRQRGEGEEAAAALLQVS